MKHSMFAMCALVAGFAVAGCGGADMAPRGTGTLVVQLTDAPFPLDEVKSVDVWVVRVDGRVGEVDEAAAEENVATEAESEKAGWKTLATPNAKINLLELQNGVVSTIGEAKVEAGAYRSFRLVIDPSKSSITLKTGDQVLTNTSSPSVTFPSASRSGIKIKLPAPVEVDADGKTTLVVDFDVGNSFVMRGNSLSQNGLLFKPVIKATVKEAAAVTPAP